MTGIDGRIELLDADACVEHAAAANDDLVRHTAEQVVVPDVRCDSLRVEGVQTGIRRLARRHHGRSGDVICRGRRPVDAAVRFEALKLCVAFERWKREHARLAVFVLYRLEQADFALDERPTDREPWSPRLDASELARAPSGPRLEVVHRGVPRIARPLRLDRRNRTRRQTELGRERSTSYL